MSTKARWEKKSDSQEQMCSVFWPNFSVEFLVDQPARPSISYLFGVLSCCVVLSVLFLSFPAVLRCVVLRFATVSTWHFSIIIYLRSTTGQNNSTDRQRLHQCGEFEQRHNFKHNFHCVFSTSKHFIFLFSFRNADWIINFITDLPLFVGSDYPPSLTNQNVYCVTQWILIGGGYIRHNLKIISWHLGSASCTGRQTYHTFVHHNGNSFSRRPFFMYLKLELKLAKRSCL